MTRAVNQTGNSITFKFVTKNNIFEISSVIARVAPDISEVLTMPSATNVRRSAFALEDLKVSNTLFIYRFFKGFTFNCKKIYRTVVSS